MSRYLVSSSPHITSPKTTRNIMLDVVIALVPCIIASMLIYGFYSFVLVLLCTLSAVFSEFLFNLIRRQEQTIQDCSAVVTGIILGLNLPPTVPVYVPVIGAIFAVMIVKMLFGGIGKNFANPAATARIFLVLSWGSVMTKFALPIDLAGGAGEFFKYFNQAFSVNLPDALTSATPLGIVKQAFEKGTNPALGLNALNMFLGKIGGSAGEVSTLAVLIGAIYLSVRKIIDVKIPIIFVSTVALFTAIFYANTNYVGEYVWTALLGGAVAFGAVFMATDYSTTPNTPIGRIIFAFGCGLLTVIIRRFSPMPEGVSFAILLMNVVSPLLDKIVPMEFGASKEKGPFKKLKMRKAKGGADGKM